MQKLKPTRTRTSQLKHKSKSIHKKQSKLSPTTTLKRFTSTSPPVFTSPGHQFYQGSIHLIMGPMFSGKTTKLLDEYHLATSQGHKTLLIKHSSDTRYHGESQVVSHTNRRENAVAVHHLGDPELTSHILDRTHIFIDEGQFFPDLDIMADKFANDGQKVFVAALDGTFQREAFPVVGKLIPKCEQITKLLSQCHTCGDDAPFSRRITNDVEIHVIGGKEKYQAACRKHFFSDNV